MASRWEASRRAAAPLVRKPLTYEELQARSRGSYLRRALNLLAHPPLWVPELPLELLLSAPLFAVESLVSQCYVATRAWCRHLLFMLPIPDSWLPERERLEDLRTKPFTRVERRARLYRLREAAYRLQKIMEHREFKSLKFELLGQPYDTDVIVKHWDKYGHHQSDYFRHWLWEVMADMAAQWEEPRRFDKDDYEAHFWKEEHVPGLKEAVKQVLEPQPLGPNGELRLLVPEDMEECSDDDEQLDLADRAAELVQERKRRRREERRSRGEAVPSDEEAELYSDEDEEEQRMAEVDAQLEKEESDEEDINGAMMPRPEPVKPLISGHLIIDLLFVLQASAQVRTWFMLCGAIIIVGEVGGVLYMSWWGNRNWVPPPEKIFY